MIYNIFSVCGVVLTFSRAKMTYYTLVVNIHKKRAIYQTTTDQRRHNENGAFGASEGLGSLRPAQLLLIAITGEGGQLA